MHANEGDKGEVPIFVSPWVEKQMQNVESHKKSPCDIGLNASVKKKRCKGEEKDV